MTSRRGAIAHALAAVVLYPIGVGAEEMPRVLRGSSAGVEGSLAILYLSAADCSVCRAWERAKRPGFVQSPEGRKAPIREIARTRIRQRLAERDWPSDLQWVPHGTAIPAATPAFILVQGERVLAVAVGVSGFDQQIVPRIRQLSM